VTSGGEDVNDFPDNQLINFVYLLVGPRFLSTPLKFLWSIALRPPVGWTPLTDTTNKRTDKQTDVSLCPFVS